jgi:hypothetical protein
MPATRPSIPAAIRLAVYRRDDWSCRFCGVRLPVSRMTLDHINLASACGACNQRKGDRTPYEAKMPMIPLGGALPPGWRVAQTAHPKRIVEVKRVERPQFLPLTDPVHVLRLVECGYCDGVMEHEPSCPLHHNRFLIERAPNLPFASRAEHRDYRRAKQHARMTDGRRRSKRGRR